MTKSPIRRVDDFPEEFDHRLVAGDPDAWRELTAKIFPILMSMARPRAGSPIEAEHLANDILAMAFARRDEWVPRKARFIAYIYGPIFLSVLRDFERARMRKPVFVLGLELGGVPSHRATTEPTPAVTEVDAIRDEEFAARLEKWLPKLDEETKFVLDVLLYEGKSELTKHIRVAYGLDAKKRKQLRRRGLRKLLTLLEKQYPAMVPLKQAPKS